MEQLLKVATCNLNQWALDFDGNLVRIVESIRLAKAQGCGIRLGPELEVSGYGCEDHFLEQDTFFHSWQSLASILDSDLTDGMLCDIGMPVMLHGVRYNCRVYCFNRRILLMRPKIFLANDGNYREMRYFSSWSKGKVMEVLNLPNCIRDINGQDKCPFGVAIVEFRDCVIASETCEELFTPQSPHIDLSLNGVEVILNGSGSHHSLRKLKQRLQLIQSATAKAGGIYLYSNQQGCDGGRLYYDGCSMVCINGCSVAQGSQFSLDDIQVVTAVVDLEEVRSYRGAICSRGIQASQVIPFKRIYVNETILSGNVGPPSIVLDHLNILTVEEEIAYGPSCWLWDYLRRSGASGFFLPLSGGADSSSTAALVGIMCQNVVKAIKGGNQQVLRDVRRILNSDEKYIPSDSRELAYLLFHSAYLGTDNSSRETEDRAKRLSTEIGSFHLSFKIDTVLTSLVTLFHTVTGKVPQFKVYGGSNAENLALQNIQARIRMVLSFLFAQLLPWVRGRTGFLLVLGSANVDEALRGYMTKYDCSSADINPIGGISKSDLKLFLLWASKHVHYPSLADVVSAQPTAELEPITSDYVQSDEQDMGMTYEELSLFGRLRKVYRCGPVSMYEKLCHVWNTISPAQVASQVKRFFFFYSVNRHKLTVLTPSYHAENYSPDDNRFDLRQFLYNVTWSRQFNTIDELVQKSEDVRKSHL